MRGRSGRGCWNVGFCVCLGRGGDEDEDEKSLLANHVDYIGFETAALPTSSDELRKQLLNFAIVGGGRKLHLHRPSLPFTLPYWEN